ncbi:metal-sensitive transcriptional regulator [Patescibacteria group bacterium]|nr:metal-sensitive transcriptional regulator [Patescibacteria group bacterium]
MFRPKNTQERIVHRLKIANGHLGKIIKMVESQEYCINILHQLHAVRKAIKEVDNIILENHLKTCATDAIRNGNQEETVKEVMNVFKKSD